MGEDTHKHLPRGDIHLTVIVADHHTYVREYDDLIREVSVSAWEAMLGKDIEIECIDGKKLTVTVAPGVQPGATLRLNGHGMPNQRDPRFRGNMLLKLKITIPTDLTATQKDYIKQFLS